MMLSLAFFFCLVVSTNAIAGISKSEMFQYGTQFGDTERNVTRLYDQPALLDSGDLLTIPNTLPSFKIYGANLGRMPYINYNGHVTFGAQFKAFDPFMVNSTDPNINAIFNVYFSDNDLRRPNGLLYYRLSQRNDDLTKANNLIRSKGFTTFTSTYCLIATWDNLRYYISDRNQRENPIYSEENTYQLVLCTDGNDGHYIYHYNKLEWTRSQDTTTNFATVGWHVKSATPGLVYWVAPNSGESSIQSMATGSNVGTAGRWMRSQAIAGPCTGRTNDVYAINCTHYRFCCSEVSERVASCPDGTSYHPTLKYCVSERVYSCGGTNFCATRPDGQYANTVTARNDDFYRCTSGVGRLLTCPHNLVFGSSARCR